MDQGQALPSFHKCSWIKTPLSTAWPSYTAVHYRSNSAYNLFNGFDLTGHNHGNYFGSFIYWPLFNHTKVIKGGLSVSFCEEGEEDGSAWHVQRIGPLTSMGGYDWWQMSASDVGNLSQVLHTHKRIYLLENYMGAVTAAGQDKATHRYMCIIYTSFPAKEFFASRGKIRSILQIMCSNTMATQAGAAAQV